VIVRSRISYSSGRWNLAKTPTQFFAVFTTLSTAI
jgi:hypothetical protein